MTKNMANHDITHTAKVIIKDRNAQATHEKQKLMNTFVNEDSRESLDKTIEYSTHNNIETLHPTPSGLGG